MPWHIFLFLKNATIFCCMRSVPIEKLNLIIRSLCFLSTFLILNVESGFSQKSESCRSIIKKEDGYPEFQSPSSGKIIFSKKLMENENVYSIQLQMYGSSTHSIGDGLSIILSNGKKISKPGIPVKIVFPEKLNIAFQYIVSVSLEEIEIEFLRNFPIREFYIGNFQSRLNMQEQNLYFNYFNCIYNRSVSN